MIQSDSESEFTRSVDVKYKLFINLFIITADPKKNMKNSNDLMASLLNAHVIDPIIFFLVFRQAQSLSQNFAR